MDNLKTVLELLPKLTIKELEDIEKRLAFLKSSNKRKPSATEEELFYKAITNGLEKRIRKKSPPFYAFTKQGSYKKFKEAFEETLNYIEVAFKDSRITRTSKQRFYIVATEVVINDFATSPVPLNLKTMLNSFTLLPSLMDKSFPGYLSGGVLSMILKAKFSDKKPREENDDYN